MGNITDLLNYQRKLISFSANQIHTVNIRASTLIVLDVTGSFDFRIGETGPLNQLDAGLTFKMPEGQFFDQITFIESAGSTGNITIGLANGDIADARSTISGDTPVKNAASPNDKLAVTEDNSSAILSHLQSVSANKAPLTDLRGASFLRKTSTTNETLVAAASNTDGVLIHLMSGSLMSSTDYISVYMDSSPDQYIVRWDKNSGEDNFVFIRDIITPADLDLNLQQGTNAELNIWYTVL